MVLLVSWCLCAFELLVFLDVYTMNVVGWIWFIVGIVFLILVAAIFGAWFVCMIVW